MSEDHAAPQTLGRKFIEKMDSAMLPAFRAAVVPIYRYAPDHDHARLLGSGSLLAIGGRYFLVTAGHVVDEVCDGEVQQDHIYVPPLPEGAFVPVVGRFTGDRTSRNDIAVIELDAAAVERLQGRRFLNLTDIDLSTAPLPAGWYYTHGYPYEDATRGGSGDEFRAKPYTLGTRLYAGDTNSLRTYVPGLHVLLEVPTNVVDGAGNEGAFPESLQGISGSPLWRAFTYGSAPSMWTPDEARVVGVETSVTSMGRGVLVVQGTRWFVVLELLRHAYPDLEPAIALYDPPRVRTTFQWEKDQ